MLATRCLLTWDTGLPGAAASGAASGTLISSLGASLTGSAGAAASCQQLILST